MRGPTNAGVFALAAVLMPCWTVAATEKPGPDHYSAVWAVVGGPAGGGTVSIDIYINKYNTDEEIKNYADLLVDSGTQGLRRALEKEDVGQLAPVGRIGTPIAIARRLQKGSKTIS